MKSVCDLCVMMESLLINDVIEYCKNKCDGSNMKRIEIDRRNSRFVDDKKGKMFENKTSKMLIHLVNIRCTRVCFRRCRISFLEILAVLRNYRSFSEFLQFF